MQSKKLNALQIKASNRQLALEEIILEEPLQININGMPFK